MYLIKTYTPNSTYSIHTFYVLNKGLNAGKPSQKPYVNSFAVVCTDKKQHDFMYALFIILWKGKRFFYDLQGTAIPFITIGNIKKKVFYYYNIANKAHSQTLKLVDAILQTDKLIQNQKAIAEKYKELQQALISDFFKKLS